MTDTLQLTLDFRVEYTNLMICLLRDRGASSPLVLSFANLIYLSRHNGARAEGLGFVPPTQRQSVHEAFENLVVYIQLSSARESVEYNYF